MDFLSVQFLFRRCILASASCFMLFSCQESGKAIEFKNFLPNREVRQQIEIPASFTPAIASKLGHQVDSIFTYLHKRRGFNGTVIYTKYDQVLYKGAFGYADFKQKDTLTTETAFQLASVSKQFTAMAIMMLQEEGELSYDDSVQQYIPEFPYNGITIRQLLTHRSGLSNYTYFSDELWPDRNVPITNEDVLDLMAEHKPAVYHKPDTHFDYSNTGYALLASIVSEASGMPFDEYIKEEIFEPLDMKNTFTFKKELAQDTTGKIATGHTGGRRKRTPDYLDTVLGDKGIYSTVEDLYKWDQALYTNKLVEKETLDEAFTGSRLKEVEEDYGFGWRIRTLPSGDTAVYHAGLWHGYNTYLLRNPKDHSALIILSNVPNGSLNYVKDLREFLYPEKPKVAAKK